MKSDQTPITYDLTYKDVVDILKIIDDSPCQELHLELEGLKLDLIKGEPTPGGKRAEPAPAPPPSGQSAQSSLPAEKVKNPNPYPGPAAAEPPREVVPSPAPTSSGIQVKSPLAGTFYRAPAPGARPFVEVGGMVGVGDQVAIVEVMKLMNSVKAPVKGTVREICVANETLVKMGQVLMVIEPS
jgi:acetyl-CoA carboxylase biotin carboxyl carrier protein